MNRTFFIAGVKFRPREEIAKAANAMKEGDKLTLVPEPTNKFDPNAVKIVDDCPSGISTFLGYVPKKFSAEVAGLLEAGIELDCIVKTVKPQGKSWEMMEVTIKDVEQTEGVDPENVPFATDNRSVETDKEGD